MVVQRAGILTKIYVYSFSNIQLYVYECVCVLINAMPGGLDIIKVMRGKVVIRLKYMNGSGLSQDRLKDWGFGLFCCGGKGRKVGQKLRLVIV